MKRTISGITKRTTASLLAFVLCFGLTACGGDSNISAPSSTISDTGNSATTGNSGTSFNYQITEESNPEVKIENQPISSFWFPEELMKWNSQEDKDLEFNKSTVPLAKRVEKDKLTPINKTQNKDTRVVALSIMNANTSGNASNGGNRVESNTFSYWQYIDTLVYWAGSSGEGLIVPPSPDVTNSAHRNGVPVLGTIFFPMTAHGGKTEWLDQFLTKDAAGTFPLADKLVEVANVYGFDGWFINQETEGSKELPLTQKHADLMVEFIKQYKAKAGDKQELMWYDSMTTEGKMDWQNTLSDKNAGFLQDADKASVADSMFLNFWWTGHSLAGVNIEGATDVIKEWAKRQEELIARQLLKASKTKATELGIDPYTLYAGVDVQSDGIATAIRWDLFEEAPNSTFTSLGLYCPSWTFFSSPSLNEFEKKENALWVNNVGNPALSDGADGEKWRGVSKYVVEKTPVNTVPFVTNFNIGNGYNFFISGVKASEKDWNNRGVADVLPTYRYVIENEEGSNLSAALHYADAFYGGNSIRLLGTLEKDKSSTIKLYSSDLAFDKDIIFSTALKASHEVDVAAILTLEDGTKQEIKGDSTVGTEWSVINYDVSNLVGKTVRGIDLKFTSKAKVDPFEVMLGNLSITKKEFDKETSLSAATIDEAKFDDETMYAGVRMSFKPDSTEVPHHYEIYRINDDESKSLMGVSTSPNYFINALPRNGDKIKMEFEIYPVNQNFERGKSAKVTMDWPDNSLPKADFKSDHTLAAPGGAIKFESTSTQNTTDFLWTFEGATPATSTEAAPTVTYEKEGVYKVSLTAKNAKGENTKEVGGLITITANAKDGLVDLSTGKEATATSFVNDKEAPPFAVDGKTETKWCATGTPPHELTINLGAVKTISEVAIGHAEAGGEGAGMNTQKYSISVSTDGKEFTEVLLAKNNKLGSTVDSFIATEAQYVKLSVIKPAQGADTAARIYEVTVFGIDKK